MNKHNDIVARAAGELTVAGNALKRARALFVMLERAIEGGLLNAEEMSSLARIGLELTDTYGDRAVEEAAHVDGEVNHE
jgi:hypothetical protein